MKESRGFSAAKHKTMEEPPSRSSLKSSHQRQLSFLSHGNNWGGKQHSMRAIENSDED